MTSETKQESPMVAKPQKEHEWLQKLIGDWTYEMEAKMGPDQPPEKGAGTESVRSFGGLWVVSEGEGAMSGGEGSKSLMTLGYDPQKRRFVGTFISSTRHTCGSTTANSTRRKGCLR